METSPIRFSKRKSVTGNILGRWTIVETVAHTLNISYQVHIVNIRYKTTGTQNGQATIGHPFPISQYK